MTGTNSSTESSSRWRRWIIPAVIGGIVVLIAAGARLAAGDSDEDNGLAARRGEVATRGARVMPFDQNRTTHVFKTTPDGGVQSVTANDATDTRQVRLVRLHLRHEAERFAAGDFDDPAAIHGMEMPGLAELRTGATRIQVQYEDVSTGGRITYTAADPSLVSALHEWFDAQLMDHGAHAHG